MRPTIAHGFACYQPPLRSLDSVKVTDKCQNLHGQTERLPPMHAAPASRPAGRTRPARGASGPRLRLSGVLGLIN